MEKNDSIVRLGRLGDALETWITTSPLPEDEIGGDAGPE
jgi:hypothetical protein